MCDFGCLPYALTAADHAALDERLDLEVGWFDLIPTRLDPGEVEQVVDQPGQPVALVDDDAEVFIAPLLVELFHEGADPGVAGVLGRFVALLNGQVFAKHTFRIADMP